jgi:hypothetical protein
MFSKVKILEIKSEMQGNVLKIANNWVLFWDDLRAEAFMIILPQIIFGVEYNSLVIALLPGSGAAGAAWFYFPLLISKFWGP